MSNETAPNPAPNSPTATTNMEALVIAMAKAVADHPDEVSVESFEDDGVMVAELTVDPDDLGKVIGRQGRTVRSMRMILEAASEKLELPWELDIVEDDDEVDDGPDSDADGDAGEVEAEG
jgi:predicted RNA-binding protein YlqC (UPF0109 family)